MLFSLYIRDSFIGPICMYVCMYVCMYCLVIFNCVPGLSTSALKDATLCCDRQLDASFISFIDIATNLSCSAVPFAVSMPSLCLLKTYTVQ